MDKEVNKVIYSLKVCKTCKFGKSGCAFRDDVAMSGGNYCPMHQNEDERN